MLQIFVVKKEHKSQKCAIWKTFFGLRRGDREMKDCEPSKQDYLLESNMHEDYKKRKIEIDSDMEFNNTPSIREYA